MQSVEFQVLIWDMRAFTWYLFDQISSKVGRIRTGHLLKIRPETVPDLMSGTPLHAIVNHSVKKELVDPLRYLFWAGFFCRRHKRRETAAGNGRIQLFLPLYWVWGIYPFSTSKTRTRQKHVSNLDRVLMSGTPQSNLHELPHQSRII